MQEDIERADAADVSGTLNEQLIPNIVAFNFGPQDVYPTVRIGRPDEVPLEIFSTAFKNLAPLASRPMPPICATGSVSRAEAGCGAGRRPPGGAGYSGADEDTEDDSKDDKKPGMGKEEKTLHQAFERLFARLTPAAKRTWWTSWRPGWSARRPAPCPE